MLVPYVGSPNLVFLTTIIQSHEWKLGKEETEAYTEELFSSNRNRRPFQTLHTFRKKRREPNLQFLDDLLN